MDGGVLGFTEHENASPRTIDLPQMTAEALRRHRKHQLEEKMLRASRFKDSNLIFATGKGTPLDAQNIVNRHFKRLLKRAGLPLFVGTI
jgi:integrase